MSLVKPGRNDRCLCGSGRKYKRCCMDFDAQEARRIVRADEDTQRAHYEDQLEASEGRAQMYAMLAKSVKTIVDQVESGRTDEVKQTLHDMSQRAAEMLDREERMGNEHESRGNYLQAIDRYRFVISILERKLVGNHAERIQALTDRIARLKSIAQRPREPLISV